MSIIVQFILDYYQTLSFNTKVMTTLYLFGSNINFDHEVYQNIFLISKLFKRQFKFKVKLKLIKKWLKVGPFGKVICDHFADLHLE